jgi:hypothetical protein
MNNNISSYSGDYFPGSSDSSKEKLSESHKKDPVVLKAINSIPDLDPTITEETYALSLKDRTIKESENENIAETSKKILVGKSKEHSTEYNPSYQEKIIPIKKALENEATAETYLKSIEKISTEIDDLLKEEKFKPFSPKLRQLKAKCEDLIHTSGKNTEREDLDKISLSCLSEYNNIKEKISNEWYSNKIFTPEDILTFSADYTAGPKESLEQFAADTTGISFKKLEIKKFISETCGLGTLKLTIKAVTPGLTSGVSGEPVFRAFDKESGKLICFIKVKNPATVASEVNALRLINNQKMSTCHFPNVMGLGKCKNSEGNDLVLFAQSPAKGMSIDKYIEKLAIADKENDKNEASAVLNKAIDSMANAMAELHNLEKENFGIQKKDENPLQVNDFSTFKSHLNTIMDQLSAYGMEVPQIDLSQNFASTSNIVHGDFHPGNVFYSEQDKFLTLIDNDELLTSLDLDSGNLKGTGPYEFAYCYQWIKILSLMSSLEPEKSQSLLALFEDRYITMRKIEDKDKLQTEIAFMKDFVVLNYIHKLIHVLQHPEHPWNQSLGEEKINLLINFLLFPCP